MFYEFNNLFGKALLVAVAVVGGFYGLFQIIEWTERYREFNRTAPEKLGKVEPIGQDFPSFEETIENHQDSDPYGLMRGLER
jgi:hypothetical protein